MASIIDSLIKGIREAATYNHNVQSAPACILWPDQDQQWKAAIPRLKLELPELFEFATHAPEQKTGPPIWLCYRGVCRLL